VKARQASATGIVARGGICCSTPHGSGRPHPRSRARQCCCAAAHGGSGSGVRPRVPLCPSARVAFA
jgi:hypothetical protein